MTDPRIAMDEEHFLPVDYLRLLQCMVSGSYLEIVEWGIECLGSCQRPENPCIVDIDYRMWGDGVYEMVPDFTLFSLDTTDGKDGTWHILQPVETDSLHSGSLIEIHGERTLRFVADLCDHISSFFSEPKVCFRITFKERTEEEPLAFDEPPFVETDPAESSNPIPNLGSGCRPGIYGTRLPRS